MQIILFENEVERPVLPRAWRERRQAWPGGNRPAREALSVVERLYEVHRNLDGEGERFEYMLLGRLP